MTRVTNYLRLPPTDFTDRQVSEVVNNILDGKVNSTGVFTCTASAASTQVTEDRAGSDSVILFMPTTANASAEFGNGTIFISARAKGSFTVTHANNSQTDRTFGYCVFG